MSHTAASLLGCVCQAFSPDREEAGQDGARMGHFHTSALPVNLDLLLEKEF